MGLKRFVYILKTVNEPTRYYTGGTSNIAERLAIHNRGGCPSTARDRPWVLDVAIEFSDDSRAFEFERYLKSGSGCAFAKRHFREHRRQRREEA